MKQLRERGIYLAPDGQSFVASKLRKTTSDGKRILSRLGDEVGYLLFCRYQWAFHGAPDFAVAPSGNIVPFRQPSNWRLDQLIDTGATAGAH